MSDKGLFPPVRVPGSLEYEHFIHPFRPSSKVTNASGTKLDRKLHIKNKKVKIKKDVDETVFDAETGKPIKLTKSIWTGREGRLDIDGKTVLAMGTGMLDILSKDRSPGGYKEHSNNHTNNMYNNDIPKIDSFETKKNDLVEMFHERGPLKVIFHKYWDPKTGEINDELRSVSESEEDIDD